MSDETLVGRSPASHYKVREMLGRGANGTVYRAEHTSSGHVVALKVLPRSMMLAPVVLACFQREAELLQAHPHPCLVSVVEARLDHSPPYLVLDYMEGGDLASTSGPGRGLPVREVVDAGVRVAEALGHLHAHGVVHRDVKPENIFRDAEGRAFLGDLGLGKSFGADPLTAAGSVVGTRRYVAPELWQQQEASPLSDLFSLGVTMIQLLTGELPDPMRPGLRFSVEALASLEPESLGALLRRLIDPDPKLRPGSASVVRELLEVPR